MEEGIAVNDAVNDLPCCKHFWLTTAHAVTCLTTWFESDLGLQNRRSEGGYGPCPPDDGNRRSFL